MTLHTPVPAVDLAPRPGPLFAGDSTFQSAFMLLTTACWHPQALALYDDAMQSKGNSVRLERQMRHHYMLSLFVAALACHSMQLVVLALLALVAAGMPVTAVIASAGWSLLLSAVFAFIGLVGVLWGQKSGTVLLWVLFLQGAPAYLFFALLELATPAGSDLYQLRLLASLYFSYWIGLFTAIALAANRVKTYDVQWVASIAVLAGLVSAAIVVRAGSPLLSSNGGALTAWIYGGLALLLGPVALLAGILRVDDWLVAMPLGSTVPEPNVQGIRRVTPLPLPGLDGLLENWLDYDWAKGSQVLQELWRETCQQTVVRHVLERKLEEAERTDKERLVERLAVLIDNEPAIDWRMLLMRPTKHSVWQLFWAPLHQPAGANKAEKASSPASPGPLTAAPAKEKRLYQRRQRWMQEWGQPLDPPRQLTDRAYRRILAVFWYLRQGYIPHAGTAAKEIDSGLKYGAELRELAAAYVALWEVERLSRDPWLKALSPAVKEKDRRRKVSWQTVDRFHSILQWEWLAERSIVQDNRETASAQINRLMEEITASCHHELPISERRIVARLLAEWSDNINSWRNSAQPRLHVPKIADNPFFFMEPLRAEEKLYGRKDALVELGQAWSRGNYQTVLICGQPRIGKTSLILNAGRDAMTPVRVAHVRLDHVRTFGRATEQILKEMVIAAHQARHAGLEEFDFTQSLWDADPFSECTHHLSQICSAGKSDIVISFDDFDGLVEQVAGAQELQQLLEYLVHLHQSIERLGIVFMVCSQPHLFQRWAGNPFAQGIRIIGLACLKAENLGNLLNKPLRSYGHRFHPHTEQCIYKLSHGHPWVAEIIAHFMVERFNHRAVAAQVSAPDPLFSSELLQEALSHPTLTSHIADFAIEVLEYVRKHLTTAEMDETNQLLPVIGLFDQGKPPAALYAAQDCSGPADEERVDRLLSRLAELEIIEWRQTEVGDCQPPCWRIQITLLARHWSGRPLTGP